MILKMIGPLNMQELFRLAEKVDEAAELIKGKDVILLLGGTGADVGGLTNDSFVLCDSPGFEDTSEPEVDIANGFGIIKAIKG
ncbi:unnamed protein product, partial [Rotaria sp. Silwood2]